MDVLLGEAREAENFKTWPVHVGPEEKWEVTAWRQKGKTLCDVLEEYDAKANDDRETIRLLRIENDYMRKRLAKYTTEEVMQSES